MTARPPAGSPAHAVTRRNRGAESPGGSTPHSAPPAAARPQPAPAEEQREGAAGLGQGALPRAVVTEEQHGALQGHQRGRAAAAHPEGAAEHVGRLHPLERRPRGEVQREDVPRQEPHPRAVDGDVGDVFEGDGLHGVRDPRRGPRRVVVVVVEGRRRVEGEELLHGTLLPAIAVGGERRQVFDVSRAAVVEAAVIEHALPLGREQVVVVAAEVERAVVVAEALEELFEAMVEGDVCRGVVEGRGLVAEGDAARGVAERLVVPLEGRELWEFFVVAGPPRRHPRAPGGVSPRRCITSFMSLQVSPLCAGSRSRYDGCQVGSRAMP
jgi:hypothetical protein